MDFNSEPRMINGPIQLPIPDHGRPPRPPPLEYRGTELPEPLHQASYPSTPVHPHRSSPFHFQPTDHQRNHIMRVSATSHSPFRLLLQHHLPNRSSNMVNSMNVQLPILHLNLLVTHRSPPTIITLQHNGLQILISRRSQTPNFLLFPRCILIPQQPIDIPIIEIIKTTRPETGIGIKININLITDHEPKCSDTVHQRQRELIREERKRKKVRLS